MRGTRSITMVLLSPMALGSKACFPAQLGLTSGQQLADKIENGVGRRRTSWNKHIHRHEFMDGSRLRQQARHSLIRSARIQGYILPVGAIVDRLGGERISHAGNVRRDRAIAERYQNLGPLTHHLDLMEIL